MSSHFMALTSLELSAAIIRAPIVVSSKMPVLAAIAQMGSAYSNPLVTEAERGNEPKAADGRLDVSRPVKADCVLVVEAGRVIGILTTQDVLRLTSQQCSLRSLVMEQVMSQPVVTLRKADFRELSVAMDLFREKRIRHLPIVDGQDRLVGLATPESLRRAAMMTERQKTEAQLRASERRYAALLAAAPVDIFRIEAATTGEAQLRAMMEAIPDLLLRVTRDGTCLDYILSPNQLGDFLPIQRHLSEALPPDLLIKQLDSIEQAIASKTVQVYEQQFSKHNHMAYEEVRVSAISSEQALIMVRDITDRKHAGQQLQLLNQQLEARVEERTAALKEREARYHALMNGASDAILLADQRGNLLEANDKAEELLGYTRAELTTMHYSQLYRIEEFSRILAATKELAIQKFVQVLDVDFLSKDGRSIPVDISASVVEINGETIIQGIFRDITERKQAERERQRLFQELQQENTFRQQLVENMTEGVCVCQEVDVFPFYRFSVWNHQMQVITGYTVEEMNRLGWYQSLHPDPDVRAQAIARMQRMHRGDNLVAEEWEIQRKDGQRRMFAISTSVLSNHNGQTCVLGLMQDITERKQAQQQLSERNQQLADSNAELARVTRLKDEFLASMSHELRTPLNAILGMTEGLLEGVFGKTSKEHNEALQTIECSSSHLLELINDILDLSKIESGQIELRCKPTAVAALCQYSLAFIKQQALKKRIQIEMQLPANLPDLLVDERYIRQALINLLNNAVKFTPEGGRITLIASGPTLSEAINGSEGLSPNCLSITVADTGIGIPPGHIETIFQPFVQIDSALNRQYTGTGLGLALVERIVRLHGGDVNINSEVGVGSRFTIDLPCTTSPPSSQETDLPSYSVIEPNPDQLKPGPIILLAEDNEASVSTISSYLRAKGYHLLVAKNGLEAIALTQSGHPDLILMDIQMPRMDGLEAIKKIRQDLNCTDVPIIALTALAMTGDRDRCLATGANDYLSKPVKLKRLTATIQQLLTSLVIAMVSQLGT